MTAINRAPGFLASPAREPSVRIHTGRELTDRLPALTAFVAAGPRVPLSRHPGWLAVLSDGMGHKPYALEAVRDGQTVGLLNLAFVRSLLFGLTPFDLPTYAGVASVMLLSAAAACAIPARRAVRIDPLLALSER